MIVNTLGWDTDCNSGNLGCLMGIKNRLEGINHGPDWRGPVPDKLYLSTADGGRSISDAASEAVYLANTGDSFMAFQLYFPKTGPAFTLNCSIRFNALLVKNRLLQRALRPSPMLGYSLHGTRSLAIQYKSLANGRSARVETPTFSPSAEISKYFTNRGYSLLASPSIYSGQTIIAQLVANESNTAPFLASLFIKHYNELDEFSDNRLLYKN